LHSPADAQAKMQERHGLKGERPRISQIKYEGERRRGAARRTGNNAAAPAAQGQAGEPLPDKGVKHSRREWMQDLKALAGLVGKYGHAGVREMLEIFEGV